ncbi:hypothetical protein ABT052_29020 [Streptomyces sp. NPDC002766]|uniref:hypothetical protein n=1 Tax=Streptomyces sp. NPDC002766 TaxID=3154429 RepID=UPI003332BB32
MTDTLSPPTTGAGADSPLALLFDIALEIGVQSDDEQSDDAETAALDHVWSTYPDTLGKALDADDWNGRPGLPGAGLEPCAVAYLDGGLWLHHSSHDQEQNVLTLIAPCTCGNGYIDTALDGERDLLQVLTELRATGGRFPHHDERPDCDSQPRLRPWGEPRS